MQVAIKLENISRSLKIHFWEKKKEILKNISLEVFQSEIFGLLGPIGAGKTTLIKIITGLLKPDSGSATIFDLAVHRIETRQRIGFLPESPDFYEHLTGYEFLKIHALLGDNKEYKNQIAELAEKLGFNKILNKTLDKYSRDMLQKVGIAQILINDPDLLILDQPFKGLDPISRKQIKKILLEEKKKGKTIFFSSHILPDIEALCDRISIIQNGEIMKTGELNELLKRGTKTNEISIEDWLVEQLKTK
jgi:ABC-2 type transport system ATP-binding protein